MKREREKQQRKEAIMMGQTTRVKLQKKNQKNNYYHRRWNDRQQVCNLLEISQSWSSSRHDRSFLNHGTANAKN